VLTQSTNAASASTAAQGWIRRLAQNLMVAAAALAACLLLAEAAARIFLPAPFRADRSAIVAERELRKPASREAWQLLHLPDPALGWVLTDHIRYRKRLIDSAGVLQYDATYTVESGRRRTPAAPPAPGLKSAPPVVIAAGCSFTFGHGLDDEDTWPWLLQEQLPERQVLNAAVMGYGTDQALMAAERQLRLHPAEAVILGFGDFQIERNRGPQGWLVSVYPFSKPLFTVRSGRAEYVRQVRFWPGGPLADYSNFFGRFVNALANRIYNVPSHDQARELTIALIATYAARFQALGTRLAVAVLPYAGDNGPQERLDRALVIGRLNALGIPVMTMTLPRASDGSIDVGQYMVSKIDRHPNRRYNQTLVEQMVPFLRDNGLVGAQAEARVAARNLSRKR